MEAYDSTEDTLAHISCVQARLGEIRQNLKERGLTHDASKLINPEKKGYDLATQKLKNVRYDSPEYKASLEELKPILEHHYAKNRHHPQHFPNGVNDMTLMDVVEMLCDWKAATERMKDGNIAQSIAKNVERFGLHPQLRQILDNTIRELGWI
jgi:hypothetical protein